MIEMWENESRAARCLTTVRPLTHSLDLREEGLAMQATRKCSVADCDKPWSHREWCEGHYRRWLDHGSPAAGRRSPVGGSCSVVDCDRPSKARSWCRLHYYRWKRTGTTALPEPVVRVCSIEGCNLPHKALGWCRLHHERWSQTGDPLMTLPNTRDLRGPLSPNWQGPDLTYQGAHSRVRRMRGRASRRACVDCSQPAAQWSYDHADLDELVEPAELGGKRYSAKPERYQPRCCSCHALFDKARR